jgi:Na+/H+ antiporter NhaD/arsenite permease-like protein
MIVGRRVLVFCVALSSGVLAPGVAFAATGLNGAAMSWPWALPFAGLLLSIATGPLLFPRFWHHHYGKVAALWALLTLVPLALSFGSSAAIAGFVHAMFAEYMSFIILLFALYTVAGGLLITGNLGGRPWSNALVLAFGTAIASIVGTTGAAMILVRPLIRANAGRVHNVHVVIFFIFLVANIGGALSPLGDPPLFVGFLRGIDFFWPAQHLWRQTLIAATLVLAIFVALDVLYARREPRKPQTSEPIRLHGLVNLPLLAAIIGVILLSATWRPGLALTLHGATLEAQNLARDAALLLIALLSLWLTPNEHRAANDFTWEPIREVAKLFAAIFVCIIPVLAMLDAGRNGAFAFLLNAVTMHGEPHEAAYFWFTGNLSAFLDNAPTYLVFLQLAGGNVQELTGPLAGTLAAISLGAVYMGALTYVGNAPNLMVYAIATERGVKMPSFFGYIGWAVCVLIPLFLILTLLPIAPILKLS